MLHLVSSVFMRHHACEQSKCVVQLKTVEGVDVDISLGNDDGVKAAEMTKAKLRDFPAARALTIVIKAFLKARRLTDVSTGGLGGYALVNMVVAHLQEEAKVSVHDNSGAVHHWAQCFLRLLCDTTTSYIPLLNFCPSGDA